VNPVVLYFASGESLYTGAVVLGLAIVLSRFVRGPWTLLFRNVAAYLSLAMIVMACPPFPWVIDALFLAAFGVWFGVSNMTASRQAWAKLRLVSSLALLFLLVALSGIEFRHRRMPAIAGQPDDHLVIIGDSISSGVDPRIPAWPVVFQELTGILVKNLARPGASIAEGIDMARGITPTDHVVLIELGGNDLLSSVPSKEFGEALELLLSDLVAPGRTVVMLELPLIPPMITYGQTQRRIAAKYGVHLIPKRLFANVIGGANATTDGIHLSKLGGRRMAELMAGALSGVLKQPAR